MRRIVTLWLVCASACTGTEQQSVAMDTGLDALATDAALGIDGGAMDSAMDSASIAIDAAHLDSPTTPDVGACACDDGIACTHDSCAGTTCMHLAAHGDCPAGQYCDLHSGCRAGGACASATDCMRPDTCATVTCNAATASCVYAVIDSDHDNHPPVVCGGDDCNDASAAIHPGASETCNGLDDDCDAIVDEGNGATTACGDQATCSTAPYPDGGTMLDGGTGPAPSCVCHVPDISCMDPFGFQVVCRDPRVDPMACGGCGLTCPTGVACVAGHCDCGAGRSACFDTTGAMVCVDTQTDATNCGTCGNHCPSGVSCVAGTCDCASQTAGTTACSGSCVDLSSDVRDCGSCGNACPSGVSCTSGRCPCAGGVTTCNGTCTDLMGTYCGACDHFCTGGGTCADGMTCTCPGDSCRTTSGTSWSVRCTNFQTDPIACGGCGNRCPTHMMCMGGTCQGCASPYTECVTPGGVHACVDTQTDDNNCGGCNGTCTFPTFCHNGGCIRV
jgi:hypothetical protein